MLLFVYFFFSFFSVLASIFLCKMWNKMFGDSVKKKFHNPVILFLIWFFFLFPSLAVFLCVISALFFSFFFVVGGRFFGGFFLCVCGKKFFLSYISRFLTIFRFFCTFFFSYRHFFFLNLYLKKVTHGKKTFFLLFLFSWNFDLINFWVFFLYFFFIGFFSSRVCCCCFTKHSYFNFFFKNEELFERRFANHTSLGCYHVYFLSASCWFSRASKQAQSGTFL